MLTVEPIRLLSDNYAYLLKSNGHAVVVDPSEAGPLLPLLADTTLDAIWCTHHHADHTGGIDALVQAFRAVQVYGSVYDRHAQRIPHQTHVVNEEGFRWNGHVVSVLEVPGHTLGAIAYLIEGNLFTGDTLFLGGCGRLFEGTADQMFQSFAKLMALDDTTRIWCGHEYTAQNLRFCAYAEPSNQAIVERQSTIGAVNVPGTIAEEKATNVFVRATDSKHFAALRAEKDTFR